MELTEVTVKLDAVALAAVQQGLQTLALHANTALAGIQAQVQEQVNRAAAQDRKPAAKPNGHAGTEAQ